VFLRIESKRKKVTPHFAGGLFWAVFNFLYQPDFSVMKPKSIPS